LSLYLHVAGVSTLILLKCWRDCYRIATTFTTAANSSNNNGVPQLPITILHCLLWAIEYLLELH